MLATSLISVINICIILPLVIKSSKTYRQDRTNEIASREGGWGSWSDWLYCNSNAYGNAFYLNSEPIQDSGDDTGSNGFKLVCSDGETISANNDTPWGYDSRRASCDSGHALKGFNTKVESPQGDGDDTALNAIRAYCTNGDEIIINSPGNWGSWGSIKMCNSGSAVCGFRQRVESEEDCGGGCDDTALNAVRLACCSNSKVYSNAEGYWIPIVRGNNGFRFSRSVEIGITDYSETTFNEENSESLENSISASMSFSYLGVGGEVSASLTSAASQVISHGSLQSVTKTITVATTMECDDGYVALYQFVTSVKESGYNQDTFTFDIKSTDYWCSASGAAPQCPYEYCNDEDCQQCKTGLFA